jgi:hypothetical protein
MTTTTKLLFVANALCLALFLGMAFLLPLHGQTQATERFTQLDKAGAINHASIAKVKITRDPASVSSSSRPPTPGPWIAASAITATRSAANVGIGLTLLNVSLFTAAAVPKKKKG